MRQNKNNFELNKAKPMLQMKKILMFTDLYDKVSSRNRDEINYNLVKKNN